MAFFVLSLFACLFHVTIVSKAKEFWLHKYKRSCFIMEGENKRC